MALTESQRDAMDQLSAITASTTTSSRGRDERLLRENGWNVQVTVEQIFSLDSGGQDAASEQRDGPTRDDSSRPSSSSPSFPPQRRQSSSRPVGSGPRGTGAGAGGMGTGGAGIGVLDVVFAPFKLVLGVFSGIWYFIIRNFIPLSILRYIPRPLLPPTSPTTRSVRGPSRGSDPTSTALAFIQDLETLTGSSIQAGSLIDLYIGGYRDFLNTLKREGKVGLVFLVCGEHEDDTQFKKEVLADPELVRVLKEKEVLVWAADSRSREGYQVAGTLLASTFPSLYFFSLLPGHAGAAPKLSIVANLAGSPSTTTSTSNILQTLSNTVIPRTSAFLARLRRERHTLEESRHLREEQDRAFREAETRDRARVLAAREQADAERREAERVAREADEIAETKRKRALWRRYARKHLLPCAPSSPAGAVRVAMRTPLNANRNVRLFAPGSSTEELFVYAETLLIPESDLPGDDPDSGPVGYEPPKNEFKIVTSFPRKEIQRVNQGGEGEWDIVKQAGGALFAEKAEGSSWGSADQAEDDSEDEDVDEE